MDFSFSETQGELVGLAAQILGDRMTLTHLKEVERSDDGIDRDTWAEFAKANLLGIAIPEAQGGLGLGFLDLCVVLREAGRHVAPLPLVPCLVSVGTPVARFGANGQLALLEGIASGDVIATAAFAEHRSDDRNPTVEATADGTGGYVVSGVKTLVPFADVASTMLVSARVAGTDQVVMLLVPSDASGVSRERQVGQNYVHIFEVALDGVRVPADAVLGSAETGREILDFTLDRTMVATSALIGGVCDQAIKLTAQYTCDRKQFERAIGTFQAVSQRMADAYINNQAIELTMLAAATHLDEGREVPDEVATAKWWASEGGNQIGHACLHVHGGISIDLDYPIHRYFLWIKQAEFTFGSATAQLLRLGSILAS